MTVEVRANTPGEPDLIEMPDWPDGWPVPAIGEIVAYKSTETIWRVTAVYWYPEPDDDAVWVVIEPEHE